MDSASLKFIGFGVLLALVSNLSRSPRWRSLVLLAGSLLFLAILAPNPLTLIPFAGFLALGYAGLVAVSGRRARLVPLAVVVVVLVYIWLKKYSFLPAASFLAFPYFTLGLSYIFFRVLHLILESAEPGDKPHIGPLAYLLYTINFTTLISGPIQRYDEFARDQFAAEPPALGLGTVAAQSERMMRGFFKVNLAGSMLQSAVHDAAIQLLRPLPLADKLPSAVVAAVLYPFFLYANFSGYMDVVIPLARLMRVRVPENFNRPFSSASFIEFWSRWHITLSNWLKAYVYNPLLIALMRRWSLLALEPLFAVGCFFVTFFLIGIWHGRTSEFAFFGVLQGGGVALNKLWQIGLTARLGKKRVKSLTRNPVYVALARGLTFSWFAFTLFWFWASWTQIHGFFHALGALRWLAIWTAIWLAASVALAAWEGFRARLLAMTLNGEPLPQSAQARVIFAATLLVIGGILLATLAQPAPPIVYKTF